MKRKIIKTIITVCLASLLAIAPAHTSFAASGGNVKNKNEVIYATLDAGGSVDSVYVVNHFKLTEAGTVTDYGDYASVINLTNTDPLTQEGDAVTFQADKGNFYYQGNLSTTDLPWSVAISYYLNGEQIEAQDLSGQSGELAIRITTRKNEAVNPVFFENYMLQISLALDTETCSNIDAPDASLASAGKDTSINFTVMPENEADLSLTATVRDFSMGGIQIAGIPLSIHMESPDTEDMLSDFEKLSDGIADLHDGVTDLLDGVADLHTGTGELADGSVDIKDGLTELSDNNGKLVKASSQIKKALSQIASSLNGSGGSMSLEELEQLPAGLTQMAEGLADISDGLTQLNTGFATAYSALDAAIQGIPDTAITQAQIDALYANTDASQYDVLDDLIAYYTAGQTIKGTYAGVKSAFDAVGTTIPTLTGSIDTIAQNLNATAQGIADSLSDMDIMEQLAQLSAGLSELSKNYGDFHRGLTDYMDGVDTLADGYTDFHDGVITLNDGVGDLYDGVAELHDGTAELHDNTTGLPDDIQSEVDDMMDQYSGSDYEPISFLSPKNENIGLVQFVLKCDGIDTPEETEGTPVEPEEETFWDRFIALFTGKEG